MLNYIMVAVGGAIGSVARFWVAGLVGARFSGNFPLATLVVNVTGSLLIGVLAAFAKTGALAAPGRSLLMVGICGGYTTFSSFSVQNLELLQNGDYYNATLNVALSLFLCMIAVWIGYIVGVALHASK